MISLLTCPPEPQVSYTPFQVDHKRSRVSGRETRIWIEEGREFSCESNSDQKCGLQIELLPPLSRATSLAQFVQILFTSSSSSSCLFAPNRLIGRIVQTICMAPIGGRNAALRAGNELTCVPALEWRQNQCHRRGANLHSAHLWLAFVCSSSGVAGTTCESMAKPIDKTQTATR